MRSTGEVLGMARTPGLAYFKAQDAAMSPLPIQGTVLLSVSDREKQQVLGAARRFHELGFRIKATRGTHEYLKENGVQSELILKLYEGRPNIADAVTNGEISLVINTPAGKMSQYDDSYIRKAAIKYRIPYLTTTAAATAAAAGIADVRGGKAEVLSLQEYHKLIS
jgi:carbamoyl-phosphate synthase large subunit